MKVFEPHPNIKVYDNVLSFNDALIVEEQCLDNDYTIGWKDLPWGEDQYFYSKWSPDEWAKTMSSGNDRHFIHALGHSVPFVENVIDKEIIKTIVNAVTLDASANTHCHQNGEFVALYYVNPEWKPEWSGETFFYDDKGQEVIYCSKFMPNRMIVFDGLIPHRFNAPSRQAPKFRFTISTFYTEATEESNTEMPEGVQPMERDAKYPDVSDLVFEPGDIPVLADDGITIIGKRREDEPEEEPKPSTNKPEISLRNIL